MPLGPLITPLIGFALTLLVFSYLLGDNPAYRFAVNFLAGLSLTYALVVLLANVIMPRVVAPIGRVLQGGDPLPALGAVVALVFGALILMKLSPRFAPWGNWSMAVLIGVGAGVAVGGALLGSLVGLVSVSAVAVNSGVAALALLGTITALMYFWYSGSPGVRGDTRPTLIRWIAALGRAYLMIAFGALFGGALVASIAALVDRLGLITQILAAIPKLR